MRYRFVCPDTRIEQLLELLRTEPLHTIEREECGEGLKVDSYAPFHFGVDLGEIVVGRPTGGVRSRLGAVKPALQTFRYVADFGLIDGREMRERDWLRPASQQGRRQLAQPRKLLRSQILIARPIAHEDILAATADNASEVRLFRMPCVLTVGTISPQVPCRRLAVQSGQAERTGARASSPATASSGLAKGEGTLPKRKGSQDDRQEMSPSEPSR